MLDALSSAPLSVSRLSVPESLQLSWTELDKSQIQGKIRDYTLEYYDIERPEFVTKIESIPPQIKEYRVKSELEVETSFLVSYSNCPLRSHYYWSSGTISFPFLDLSLGKIYNFRVIPATKMGLPKHMDDKAFPWMSFAISETTNDSEINVVNV